MDARTSAASGRWGAGITLLVGVLAAAASALAADATQMCREAEGHVRDSERKMFARDFEQAAASLAKAEELIGKVKEQDPQNSRLKSVESRFARQKVQLEKRMGTGEPAPKADTTPGPAAKAAPGDKLPGGVTYRLKKINGLLDQAETTAKDETEDPKRRANRIRSCLVDAEALIQDIDKQYAAQIPADHPDIKAMQDHLAAVKQQLATLDKAIAGTQARDDEAKAKAQALADEWLAKLRPYVASQGQEGHDPAKYFISGGTVQVEELLKRTALYNEASAVFAEYRKVQFPADKPAEMEAVETDLAHRLNTFPEQLKGSMSSLYDAAAKQIGDTAAFFAAPRQQAWRNDAKEKPYTLSQSRLADLRTPLDIYKKAAGADDPKVADLEKKLSAIVQENDERRKAAAERTLMLPDRFAGNEMAALKAKAEELVREKVEGVKPLRTTVISQDWKEERATEFTDTTRTAVRHRVTRSVTAQVAGKVGDQTWLYTVHLAQDHKADGAWGPLYGNLHQTADPMLEANVSKSAP